MKNNKNIDKLQRFIDFVNWHQDNDEDEKHTENFKIILEILDLNNKNYEEAYYELAYIFKDYLENNMFQHYKSRVL